MHHRTMTIPVLVSVLLVSYAGAARTASLPVVIEHLSPAASACGLSESQLESVALRTLQNSRFQPEAGAGGSLNVRVTVSQRRRNPCLARVSVRMKALAKPSSSGNTTNPKQRSRAPVVVLCNKAGDYSAPKAALSLKVESAVEYYINRCLASFDYR